MAPSFDLLVCIGRLQPIHAGHLAVLRQALARARRVLLLLGSAGAAPSARNPWSWTERAEMVRACLPEAGEALAIRPLPDRLYNDDAWIRGVQAAVAAEGLPPGARVGLIGWSKDASSYYLERFPQWGAVAADPVEGISATPLRAGLLGAGGGPAWLAGAEAAAIPPEARRWLERWWYASPEAPRLAREQGALARYRARWADAPYPPTFVTVDAVVTHAGHLLLVRRRSAPGEGLWALPGGFVEPHETLRAAMLRELRQETRLRLPAPVLEGAIAGQRVFDDPWRSERGRTITHAFHLPLRPQPGGHPAVRGGSDAAEARWIPLGEIRSERMFEDHWHVVQEMTGGAAA